VARGCLVVGEAAGAREALALARETQPEGVLLDVNLPDGDGLAVAALLCEEGGPIVVVTSGDAAAALGRLALRSGAAGFVPKEELSGRALDAFFKT